MAYAGLEQWNARGGSIQARPDKPTMRITSWLFAFVSIHSACVKLIKQSLVFPGDRWEKRRRQGELRIPHVHRLSVKRTEKRATGTTMANDSIQVSGCTIIVWVLAWSIQDVFIVL